MHFLLGFLIGASLNRSLLHCDVIRDAFELSHQSGQLLHVSSETVLILWKSSEFLQLLLGRVCDR